MTFHHLDRYIALELPELIDAYAAQPEEQNSDYQSGNVKLRGETWRIRSARVTPTKPGAFVATWTRDERGETRPFLASEALAGLLVFVEDGPRFGVFKFTPDHLQELGYVTPASGEPSETGKAPKGGKRGFRVYPSWCDGLNPQASKTQRAQARAFTQYR